MRENAEHGSRTVHEDTYIDDGKKRGTPCSQGTPECSGVIMASEAKWNVQNTSRSKTNPLWIYARTGQGKGAILKDKGYSRSRHTYMRFGTGTVCEFDQSSVVCRIIKNTKQKRQLVDRGGRSLSLFKGRILVILHLNMQLEGALKSFSFLLRRVACIGTRGLGTRNCDSGAHASAPL